MALIRKNLTPEDNARKKQAGELLKNADKLLRAGEFEEALREVDKTLEIDPKNFYARAYKERIAAAQAKAALEGAEQANARPPEPERTPEEISELRRMQAEDLKHVLVQKRKEETTKLADGERPRQTQEESRKKYLDAQRHALEEEKQKTEDARRRSEEELRRRGLELDALREREIEERTRAEAEKVAAAEAHAQLEAELARKEVEIETRLAEERRNVELQRTHDAEQSRREQEKANEASRKQLEEERLKFEAEARRKADDEARAKYEAELSRRLEEERLQREEESALAQATQEALRDARSHKIKEYHHHTEQFLVQRAFDEAITEVTKILVLDPDNSEARRIEQIIAKEKKELWKAELVEQRSLPAARRVEVFQLALARAWSDGTPDSEVGQLLAAFRSSLELTPAEQERLEPGAKREAYRQSVQHAWTTGTLQPQDAQRIARLRTELHITDDQHSRIEAEVHQNKTTR